MMGSVQTTPGFSPFAVTHEVFQLCIFILSLFSEILFDRPTFTGGLVPVLGPLEVSNRAHHPRVFFLFFAFSGPHPPRIFFCRFAVVRAGRFRFQK